MHPPPLEVFNIIQVKGAAPTEFQNRPPFSAINATSECRPPVRLRFQNAGLVG